MKYTYKKMASGGKVGKGYTEKERKSLSDLIGRELDPYGEGRAVTTVKKKPKKMAQGGMVGGGSSRNTPSSRPSSGSYGRGPSRSGPSSVGYGGGRGPGNVASKLSSGVRTAVGSAQRAMRYAGGGIIGAPARSHRDMRAGAGSGVGRIQKTKIQRGR